MSDVATILANIKSQALVGNTNDPTDLNRLMNYLNKTYLAVYARLAQANPSLFQQFQTVNLVNGAGAFPNSTYTVLTVWDTVHMVELTQQSLGWIEQNVDATLSQQGSPQYYDRLISGLYCFPINTQSVQVRYVPNPALLTQNTLEAAIMLPPIYHEILEWGTLVTLAYDERDTEASTEIQLCQAKYSDMMDGLLAWAYAQRPPTERTVQLQPF